MTFSIRSAWVGLATTLAAVGCGRSGYKGPVSDHFDGERFHNAAPIEHDFGDLWRWLRTRDNQPWERIETFDAPPPPPAHVTDGLRITWINHATVLIQVDGANILTDPVFSERVSPVSWFGPRRYHPPGVAFDHLPPIDVVLISHAHYDHLDKASIQRLARRFSPLFVAGLGLADWLKDAGAARVATLDWWEAIDVPGGSLRLTAAPAQHWSRRGLFDRNRTLWASYWIDTPSGDVYFAGDTGIAPHFDAIRTRLGTPRVALLPIGAYEPRWFMSQQHMNPNDAVTAHQRLGATHSIGIHFATFKLSDEARFAPVDDLTHARDKAGIGAAEFWAPTFGGAYQFD